MSTFKQSLFKIEGEDQGKSDLNVTTLEGNEKIAIKEVELNNLKGHSNYRDTKEKYGVLAATDTVATGVKHQRFQLNSIIKKSLSIEEEEQRFVEERVKKRIDELFQEVKAQAQKEGCEEGFKAGSEEGLKQRKAESHKVLGELENLVSSFEGIKEEMFKANEKFLMEIIFKISKKILLRELSVDKEYLLRLVQELILSVDVKDHVTVVISAEDHEMVGSLQEGLLKKFSEMKNIRVEPSHQVRSGDCQIKTDWYVIESNLETQLKRIYEALFGNQQKAL